MPGFNGSQMPGFFACRRRGELARKRWGLRIILPGYKRWHRLMSALGWNMVRTKERPSAARRKAIETTKERYGPDVFSEHWKRVRADRRARGLLPAPVEKTCAVCGTSFTAPPSQS